MFCFKIDLYLRNRARNHLVTYDESSMLTVTGMSGVKNFHRKKVRISIQRKVNQDRLVDTPLNGAHINHVSAHSHTIQQEFNMDS